MRQLGQVGLSSNSNLWLCLQASVSLTLTNSTFWKCLRFTFSISMGLISRLASSETTWSTDTDNFLVYGIQTILSELQASALNLVCCGSWLASLLSLCLCVWFSLFSYKLFCCKSQLHDWVAYWPLFCELYVLWTLKLSWCQINMKPGSTQRTVQHSLGPKCVSKSELQPMILNFWFILKTWASCCPLFENDCDM